MSLQSDTNNDIFIIPSQSLMQFSGSEASPIVLYVEPSGAVNFIGTTGSILKIMDNLSGSLFSVNNISGLSILEVFSNNQVKIGDPANYALVVSGSNVIITGSLVDKSSGTKFLVVDTTTGVVYTTGSGGGGGGSPTTPASPINSIQYNNAGAFGAVATLTYDGTTLRATGSFTGSLTGSLFGTASWAQSASQAISASHVYISSSNTNTLEVSYVTPGVIALLAKTGSGSPSGNVNELQYNAGGNLFGGVASSSYNSGQLTLGNLIATGSLLGNASFATTASYVNLVAGPRIQAINYSGSIISVTGSIGGSDTQIQYNAGSTFAGTASFAFIYQSQSLQQGEGAAAQNFYSHAEGQDTTALGYASHVEGYATTTLGLYSHAEGSSTSAIGEGSHAEGGGTTASGSYSHAEGEFTQAIGRGSHTEGSASIAFGISSHAEGWNTVALGRFQHVQGQYNISSSVQSAFIIGNGTSNSARSNLVFTSASQFQITGSARITGSLIITGTFENTSDIGFNNTVNNPAAYQPHMKNTNLGRAAGLAFYLQSGPDTGPSGSRFYINPLHKGYINPDTGSSTQVYYSGGMAMILAPSNAGFTPNTDATRPMKYINAILGIADASNSSFEWHSRTTFELDRTTLRAKLDVPSGNFMTSGSINIASDSTYTNNTNHDALYFGNPGNVGSWRIALSASSLVVEKWNIATSNYSKSATFT